MIDASTAGSLAKTSACSQMVRAVEMTPVYSTAPGTAHCASTPFAASACGSISDQSSSDGHAPAAAELASRLPAAITAHWSAASGSASSSVASAAAFSRTTYDAPKPSGCPNERRSARAKPPPARTATGRERDGEARAQGTESSAR
eukprot:7172285-Prymnesium_polylepis.1